MKQLYRAIAPVSFFAALVNGGGADAERVTNPLQFFSGTTVAVSTLKVVLHKPSQTRSVGRGNIQPDGSLRLVQRVEGEGRPPSVRTWLIRQAGPGRFVGTMSEAAGPVTIEQVGSRYHFRFKMSGGLSVEEWLTPLPGARAVSSNMTIRKFGMQVASSVGVIRKISS